MPPAPGADRVSNHCKSPVGTLKSERSTDQIASSGSTMVRSTKIGNQTDRLAHSPGEPPAELAGRFETRTAPMVTCGGDADPAGALPGLIMPAAIMARPSRVGLLISFTFSLTSSLAASGCPVLILRILLTKTFG